MTKEALIYRFERNNWRFGLLYRKRLLALSYPDLVAKLNHLRGATAITEFKKEV
jgi:hypothetical protein